MSRRYCSFVLYGLTSLTTGLFTNAHGSDFQTIDAVDTIDAFDTIDTVGTPILGYGGSAVVPQVMHPIRHDEGLGDPEPNRRILREPFEAGEIGWRQRDIIPPGTLGQTYLRVSHPVPLDKHPRTGMLAVKDNGKVPYLSVGVMGGVKMKNGIWLFESTRPLDPGACQIVRVEARETPQDVEPYATRFVRLIPGRIVYLDFAGIRN